MGGVTKRFTVTVEGNIGCGKSTFLRYFDQLSENTEVLQEPLYLWKDARGHNLFELMYKDSTRWAIPFQAQVLVTLLDRQLRPQTAPVRLVERSIYSCRYCFVENMHSDGHISVPDYKELDEIFDWAFTKKAGPIDLIVYLRASPTTCLDRVRRRNRAGEDSIPLAYLQSLHERHEAWLMQGRFGPLPAPILVFDCEAPLPKLLVDYRVRQSEVMCGVPITTDAESNDLS
ncbi:hypothetical protein CRM22_010370 [Opisthorchis felineus]|uniref:Deoxynucleoside kinase domain-containing protein n=2 Tax=Opisthorchis felineus TaxID=147828 RepID=A0A4S2KZ99_OPIFE|nr:hypothetical protein CRM22_010370 [Opisthorchis felineus]